MKVIRRPNPAVAQAERQAQSAQNMADNALMNADSQPNVARATQALANRKKSTASKIKVQRPYLIEQDNDAQ